MPSTDRLACSATASGSHWAPTRCSGSIRRTCPTLGSAGISLKDTLVPFFCGDLFTQGGADNAPLTESDILGPSEAFRAFLDYYAHSTNTRAMLDRLATTNPRTLACMHGSAWRGDGAALLCALARALDEAKAARM